MDHLHERCRTQGLETTYVHYPVYKATLKNNFNSMIVPYSKLEKPTQKFCLGNLPVIEILTAEEGESLLPQSSALREELFSLHW